MESLIIVAWLACGVIAAIISDSKGRSGCGGLLLGLLLGPIGLAVALLLGATPEKLRDIERTSPDRRQCSACREIIAHDATICPHCRTSFS